MELGKIIKQARIKKGMTQLELSKKLGYNTLQFISLMELGKSKVPHETIGKLVVILNLPEQKIKKYLIAEYSKSLKTQIAEGKTIISSKV